MLATMGLGRAQAHVCTLSSGWMRFPFWVCQKEVGAGKKESEQARDRE